MNRARGERATLSQSDVERLLKDPSGDARANAAAMVASQFDSGELSDDERNIAEDIFKIMVRNTEVRVREALSAILHQCGHLSRDVAKALAQDVVSVSLPVIQFSTVFTDDDLIELIRTDDIEKRKAMARRETVSISVSTALVDTGKEEVVSTLVSNEGRRSPMIRWSRSLTNSAIAPWSTRLSPCGPSCRSQW